jgi:NAD-dependent dihydropyrimidine dehydrogenase PreA subunit
VCADACPVGEKALTIDEAGHPVVRHEGCVGCGVCVRECITSPSSFQLTILQE